MLFALRHCRRSSIISSSFSLSAPLLHKHTGTVAATSVANARGTQRLSSLASLQRLTLLDARLVPHQTQDSSTKNTSSQPNPSAVHVDTEKNTVIFGTESRITDLLNALQATKEDVTNTEQIPLVVQATDGEALISHNTRLRDLVRDTTAGDNDVVFRLSSMLNGGKGGQHQMKEGEQYPISVDILRPPPMVVLSALLHPERVKKRRDDLHATEKSLVSTIQTLEGRKAVMDAQVERSLWYRGSVVGVVLIAQWFGLAWGTFEGYSWDVMEPLTYFLGVSVTIAGASYFAFFKTTDSYQNVWGRWRMKKREKLYKELNFDPVALDNMHSHLAKIQSKIASQVAHSR